VFRRWAPFSSDDVPEFGDVRLPATARILGIERGGPEEQELLARFGGAINRFVNAQRQQLQLSGQPYARAAARGDALDVVYTFAYGREQVDIVAKNFVFSSDAKQSTDVMLAGALVFANVNSITDDNFRVYVNGNPVATLDFAPDDELTTHIIYFGSNTAVTAPIPPGAVVRDVYTVTGNVLREGRNTIRLELVQLNFNGTYGIVYGQFVAKINSAQRTSGVEVEYTDLAFSGEVIPFTI